MNISSKIYQAVHSPGARPVGMIVRELGKSEPLYTQEQLDAAVAQAKEDAQRVIARKCQGCPHIITPETQEVMIQHTAKVLNLVMGELKL